jgi:hypothetical protein
MQTMLKLQPILEQLEYETDFASVTKSTELKPNLLNRALTASIISYENLQNIGEGFADYGERHIATVLVQLTTSSELEEADLKQVYLALTGWSPDDEYNRELSAFSLAKANLIDINNGHFHWFLEFQITIPTIGGCI